MELKFCRHASGSQHPRSFNRTAYGIEIAVHSCLLPHPPQAFNRTAYGIEISVR